jgi:radical SAM protein with 4Fe4S-binding SPASM domain
VKSHERTQGLLRTPQLLWNVLARGRYDFTYDMMPMHMRQMSIAKRWNLCKSGVNLVHRSLTPWNMPLHMQVELTSYCTLHCPICPVGIRMLKRSPMAVEAELFERLMAEVGPYLLTLSLWGWGEPLLHPQLSRILQIARRYPVMTMLSTNGQQLDREEVLQALIEYPPTYLIVAIDGLEDETNRKFRVGAKLEPILDGVRRLAEYKRERHLDLPILHMRYIVMKHNQHELARLQEFAREHLFDFLTIRTLSIIDAPETVHLKFVPDTNEFRAYDYKEGKRAQRSDFICQQPFWFPSMFADGTVVACEQDYNAQQSFGVLSDQTTFTDIWFSERAARIRKKIRDRPTDLSFCRNCPYADRRSNPCSVQGFDLAPIPRQGALMPA